MTTPIWGKSDAVLAEFSNCEVPNMAGSEANSGGIGNLIFLSYRRADAAPQTLALKLELETNLRAAQVFLDTHVIQAGDAWPSYIENALSAADVIIPIIGKSWEGMAENGQRRIDEPTDWVRREIEFALTNKRNRLIPILVDAAAPRHPDDLPEVLRELANVQMQKIDANNWDESIETVLRILKEKFNYDNKNKNYKFPNPDPLIAKTIPYPWNDLMNEIPKYLPNWRVEFSEDPTKLFYKRIEIVRDFEFKSYAKEPLNKSLDSPLAA